MANGTNSQVQFRFQRPISPIYRVGPTGSNMFFTSIQTAINQAVADGFTSSANPAEIEIYPGTYVENVSLNPGVNLKGMLSYSKAEGGVVIQGSVTYNVAAGTFPNNDCLVDSIQILPPAATVPFTFSGAGGA